MNQFNTLEEVGNYLKSIGYEDVTVYKRGLTVKKNWSMATVCKDHSTWHVDVSLDQSGYDYYVDDLQEVVHIIIKHI